MQISKIQNFATIINAFPANVPIMEKPGGRFLLAKWVKNTCGRVKTAGKNHPYGFSIRETA